jgi:serine phosphatase RsbU (regulator of sigma subunit)
MLSLISNFNTMNKAMRSLLSVIIYFHILSPVFSQGFDDQTRAIYILDISKYVQFPPQFTKQETFTIGILDKEDKLFLEVNNVANSRKFVQGKPVKLFLFRDISEIKPTNVIYVNKNSNIKITSVISRIQGNSTLLISEGYEFRESMLNFVVINGKTEFEVNETLMNKEGLKVSQLFLEQAIKTREDWQKLFEKTDVELKEEKVVTSKQKEVIDDQSEQISQQERLIKLQEQKLDSLDKEIKLKQSNIRQKEITLNRQEIEITDQKNLIKNQLEEVKHQKVLLSDLEQGIKEKEIEIGRKTKTIEQQNGKINEQLKLIEKQRLISLFTIIALILVSGIGYFIYLNYRNKKKANKILEEKNHLITLQNEEIQKQKEIAEMQRDQIAYQKKHITDSIHYALRIQRAILPSLELFTDEIEHFVLYKPRDIVSGDFYWVYKFDHNWIIIVADCTGHGVPGAFMSMLGVSFLNEIIINKKIYKPDLILNSLRQNIIYSLKQMETQSEVKDGMDITVCVLNTESGVLEWAGANNPLFIVQNGQLEQIKGDKMPVAIHDIMEPFSVHSFKLSKGDSFYTFSDGYVDQFGGQNQKKFLVKNFKEIIMSIQESSMLEQGRRLDEVFEDWKKDVEQVDDVTVIGIRY